MDDEDISFIDTLIANEQKIAISQYVVQQYLQGIWQGNLTLKTWQMMLFFGVCKNYFENDKFASFEKTDMIFFDQMWRNLVSYLTLLNIKPWMDRLYCMYYLESVLS